MFSVDLFTDVDNTYSQINRWMRVYIFCLKLENGRLEKSNKNNLLFRFECRIENYSIFPNIRSF